MQTASNLAWAAAGRPDSGYEVVGATGPCATCGVDLASRGVAIAEIEGPSTANHADLFRFGSKHCCPGCAWLFNAGKGRPGNFLATPARFEQTVISLESVVEDKRPWLTVLTELARLPADTPCAGVMTTDVKPRLWPRTRLCCVGSFGLYIHCPDYDVSEYRPFSLAACLSAIDTMLPILAHGFAKASIYFGLLRDYARTSKDPARAIAWESALVGLRGQAHFLPALIAAGVTKESKQDVKSKPTTEKLTPTQPAALAPVGPDAGAALSGEHHPAQLGLF